MKQRGFTLIELLAVITILAIIALIVTPIVMKSVRESKEETYVQQTSLIEETAERWSIKNAVKLSETKKNYLDIPTLVKEGYLSSDDIKDPRDQSKMNGCIVIEYDNENNQFSFNYVENTCSTLKGA